MSARILIVEDNPDNMKLVEWVLEDAGYTFVGAATAEAALEVVETDTFDLILMDISLPNMDGAECTLRLRADPRFQNLPIIAVTAHAVKGEEARIRASGVNELVTKPIDEDHLLEVIRGFLDGAG